jgi:hypothetical protein
MSLQLPVFVSMENVFCNQLVSKNQFLRGEVFANCPHVIVLKKRGGKIGTGLIYLRTGIRDGLL